MDPDQPIPQLPLKSDSTLTAKQAGSEIQRAAEFLPRSVSVRVDEKIAIARQEGFHPLAIELAIGAYETPTAHKFLLFGLAVTAFALVAFLFPVDRFFKPQTQELGTMTIGDPMREDSSAFFPKPSQPWLKVLLEMDRLYFQEGKLTEAILLAETNLRRVPEKNWESWNQVHYRYWELLADAGQTLSLKTATTFYLKKTPEDPFANYYAAHAFLVALEPIRSFNRKTRQAFRLEAETLVPQIDRACNALGARQKAGGTKKQTALWQNLYLKLRLQQAKLFVLIWRLGGYEEDSHPDVAYRDKALDILDHDELVNLKEAKALKISIYNLILDRWHWLEGQQVIQGIKQKRRAMVEELRKMQKELKDAKTL